MSTALIQVRIDDKLKEEAVTLYESMGIDISTAIRIFFKKSLAVGGIPFSLNTSDTPAVSPAGLAAFNRLREQAKKNGTANLSQEAIDMEIQAVRMERKA